MNKFHRYSEFIPADDVREMNTRLGVSRERSRVISEFLRAVKNGVGVVYVPGFGTFEVKKK